MGGICCAADKDESEKNVQLIEKPGGVPDGPEARIIVELSADATVGKEKASGDAASDAGSDFSVYGGKNRHAEDEEPGMGMTQSTSIVKHRASVHKAGFEPHSLTDNLPIFDVNLHEEPGRFKCLAGYFGLCLRTDLMVTLSCFAIWAQNKKANGYAKVIPAVPIKPKAIQSLPQEHQEIASKVLAAADKVRVFFFDDNLNLDDGSAAAQGICNLRHGLTGEYLDFTAGRNGFRREHAARHTILHHSTEFRVVLVQANILDAMEDEEYFTKILSKYTLKGEKIIVYMDVNSTIVCVDTVTDKSMSTILLSTMLEFVEIQPRATFDLTWEDREPVKVDKKMNVKQLVKKIAKDDIEFYHQFYEPSRCETLFSMMAANADIKWTSKKSEKGLLTLEEFCSTYDEYLDTMAHGANEMGITMSWFRCYDFLREGQHATCLNSFGVDTKKVLSQTVSLDTDVMHVTVNHKLWDARDHQKFEQEYGVTCQRKSMVDTSVETKTHMQKLVNRDRAANGTTNGAGGRRWSLTQAKT